MPYFEPRRPPSARTWRAHDVIVVRLFRTKGTMALALQLRLLSLVPRPFLAPRRDLTVRGPDEPCPWCASPRALQRVAGTAAERAVEPPCAGAGATQPAADLGPTTGVEPARTPNAGPLAGRATCREAGSIGALARTISSIERSA